MSLEFILETLLCTSREEFAGIISSACEMYCAAYPQVY
jgi:hypothetical protein